MEQISSKILSLHMEECRGNCPNSSVCYHLKKSTIENNFYIGYRHRKNMLEKKWTIHESICNPLSSMHYSLLKQYNNYNITISSKLWEPYLDNVKNQVQLTVYNEDKAEIFHDYQKLFLIHDNKTWEFYLKHCDTRCGIHKMHYNIDLEFVTKERLMTMIQNKMFTNDFSMSIPTCISNYMVNSRFPCQDFKYIDITKDGTARRCPYIMDGLKISDHIFNETIGDVHHKNYDRLFELNIKPVKCKFMDILGG